MPRLMTATGAFLLPIPAGALPIQILNLLIYSYEDPPAERVDPKP